MTNSLYRNTLIVAGIAVALGLAGCGKNAAEPTADTTRNSTVAEAAKTTGEAAKATGAAATQAVSDTWITTKIKSVLLADPDAKGLDVNVDTKDGVVMLEGELATQAAVDHVTALAADVEGVKRVDATALTVARP
ncbi:BON domain-containing protein [Thioalkalivibrio sp. XN279]|uniref:BON domain-containing protein n=1 Tax=Thioalkalivibrio sp. XN279 TaxID=2714953 RepID=UPI00140B6DE6|nr:BON domain-containing protein [Thioalkalivibrio sp. XN279]NHA14644.1 BON domain-containing protein [Thioalkalivibrio sp. XN279]